MSETTVNHEETYYALWHPEKGYYCEFGDDGVVTTQDVSEEDRIYTRSNDERLKFHLIEYEDRLKDFVIVEIKLKVEKTYSRKVHCTLKECFED